MGMGMATNGNIIGAGNPSDLLNGHRIPLHSDVLLDFIYRQ
jgi:hypothetical protein